MGCCNGAKRLATGAVKRAKSVAGIGLAPRHVIDYRRAMCRMCEHAVPCDTQPGKYCMCSKCGCPLKHKTRLAGDACPVGKWQREK